MTVNGVGKNLDGEYNEIKIGDDDANDELVRVIIPMMMMMMNSGRLMMISKMMMIGGILVNHTPDMII
jgi:hypothetical protein